MTADQQIPAELIQKIREQDSNTLKAVYKEVYPMVKKYIIKNSGSEDDAADVFQDALYLLIKKCENPGFELTSKLSTFVVGIAKNLWLKKLTKSKVDLASYQDELIIENLDDNESIQLERASFVKRCIDALGEPCKTIIVQFYFEQASMQEIAESLKYTNANNAKNQKYKCLMRLKKMIEKEKPVRE